MKKLYFVCAFVAIFFIACIPQVTATPEVTLTLTPLPTETLAPALTATPSLTATPTTETVTLGGVTLTLDEKGVATEMKVNGNYTEEQKAEKLAAVDPTNWGFEPGEVQIVKEGSKLSITPMGESEVKIASWYYGTGEWEWDWGVMEELESTNPLFDFAKTFPTINGINVRGTLEVQADAGEIRVFCGEESLKIRGSLPNFEIHNYTIYLYEGTDRTEAIVARVLANGSTLDPNKMIKTPKIGAVVDGWICFKTTSGKLVIMKFGDIEVFIRGFN